MFRTDNTKQLSDILYLASDSYRTNTKLSNSLILSVVVCLFPRKRRRIQISLDDDKKKNLFFTGSWL